MKLRREPRTTLAVAIVLALPLWAAPALAAESYSYDTQSRLTDVTYQNGGSLHYTYDANGNILSVVTSLATAVGDANSQVQFALGPATPNPGSGPRSIVFSTPTRGHVTLRVFDVSGREVATLYNRTLDPGRYVARFSSDRWASGVYFFRLQMEEHARTGRMVVVR